MSELKTLPNIGVETQKKLNSVGITTAEKLIELGDKEAFLKIKAIYPDTCLMFLYGLHGAVNRIDIKNIPQSIKKDLKHFRDKHQ